MKKKLALYLVLCMLVINASFSVAEPVLPKYVVPQEVISVRSETSQSGDNIILDVGTNDLLQVIGYSYDMESNLWWRVIDYRTGKDGYVIVASLDEMDEVQAEKEKERIDIGAPALPRTPAPTVVPTEKPTLKPTTKPTQKPSSYSSGNRTLFTNAYGTATTRCAVSGCYDYIASSGDTNCCTRHSNKCLECRKYIDGDAMYCMSCIASALYGF